MTYTRDYPSDRYLEMLLWCRRHHRSNKTFDGTRAFHAFPTLRALCEYYRADTLVDYGAGKGLHLGKPFRVEKTDYADFAEALGTRITPYDPAWQPYAAHPSAKHAGLLCNDVLQFVPADDLPWMLQDIFSLASRFVLLCVACEQGKKPWGDAPMEGETSAVRPASWWLQIIDAAYSACYQRGQSFPDVVLRIRGYNPPHARKHGLWMRSVRDQGLVFVGEDNLCRDESGQCLVATRQLPLVEAPDPTYIQGAANGLTAQE